MKTILITIVATVVGSLIAHALSARQERAFQPPPARDAAALEPCAHSVLIRASAYLVLTAWACIYILVPGTVIWALATGARYVPVYMLVVLGALIVVIPVYLLLALWLRCRHCGRRFLIQTIRRPPYGEPSRNTSAWERLIVRIAFHDRFRCMYCGQSYSVRPPALEAQ